MTSALAVVLLALGLLARLAPLPLNAAPIGALALYAGARLPRKWALAVSILALVASDALLVHGGKWASSLGGPHDLVRYATIALVVLAASRRPELKPTGRILSALGASTLFFLTSNFAVWAFPIGLPGEPGNYPPTLAGLAQCYAAGLAFFNGQNFFLNQVVGDLVGVGVLFGLDALVRSWASRRADAAAPAA